MTPIDIQVSRSKVKVKGHASLLHLVQLTTQERFAPEASHLVDDPIYIQVSRSKVKVEGQAYSLYVGDGGGGGALVFYKHLFFSNFSMNNTKTLSHNSL